jgi:hypothetical protein
MFQPHMAIIRQHYCSWGEHCTVQFVFCALRHIVVSVSFFRRILPLYFLAAISVFFVVYFVTAPKTDKNAMYVYNYVA